MPDTSGHDATRRDELHTVTVRELEAKLAAAGVLISRRQLLRHCAAGTFDAKKLPATNNIEEWFVAPASVEKGIADIRTLQEQRARRDTSRRDMSDTDQPKSSLETDSVASGHDVTRRDVSEKQIEDEQDRTRPDMSRHVTPDLDIYEHPYVKRLEAQVDKLEKKYDDQVRRTEEIQINSQKQILELQRMTAIGQSQTLADFMLKAKEWLLGQGSEPETKAPVSSTTTT
jgi:hypothetical protein